MVLTTCSLQNGHLIRNESALAKMFILKFEIYLRSDGKQMSDLEDGSWWSKHFVNILLNVYHVDLMCSRKVRREKLCKSMALYKRRYFIVSYHRTKSNGRSEVTFEYDILTNIFIKAFSSRMNVFLRRHLGCFDQLGPWFQMKVQ